MYQEAKTQLQETKEKPMFSKCEYKQNNNLQITSNGSDQ